MVLYYGAMGNRVYLDNDNVIRIEVVGDQNAASVELMGRQTETLITLLKSSNKPVLVLDDLLQMGKVNTEARNLVVELAKKLPYDRLAMLGPKGMLSLGANLMLRATGRSEKVHYFTDSDQAMQWLFEKPQQ